MYKNSDSSVRHHYLFMNVDINKQYIKRSSYVRHCYFFIKTGERLTVENNDWVGLKSDKER